MPSLYAKYLTERTEDLILENDKAFCTYRYLNNEQVYIIDIYVLPEYRKLGIAKQLADHICQEAKDKGCTEVIGTVNLLCKATKESMLVLMAYGMTAYGCSDNVIFLKKRL